MQNNLKKQDISAISQNEEKLFYKYKNGQIYPYLKEDIKKVIDPYKPSTFLPFLIDFDIPFIKKEWMWLIKLTTETGKGPENVFGLYLGYCKFSVIKDFGFNDSLKFD